MPAWTTQVVVISVAAIGTFVTALWFALSGSPGAAALAAVIFTMFLFASSPD